MQALIEQLWSPLEATAVALALSYLVLAIRQNILCWLCAAVSSALFVYLTRASGLYMEAAVHGFYFAMAVYGFSVWYRGRSADRELPVTVLPFATHAFAIAAIVVLSLISGDLLDTRTAAAFPYIDSLTTFAAFWATFLVARKVLENWWYWLVIDAALVVVYWLRGLELTALLFVVYLIMIPFGLISWTRSWREARA